MTTVRTAIALLIHAWHVARAGQIRFRLETFGLYYPSAPYARPWWRVTLRTLFLLARQSRSYARWVVELEDVRDRGPEGWWGSSHVSSLWIEADRDSTAEIQTG